MYSVYIQYIFNEDVKMSAKIRKVALSLTRMKNIRKEYLPIKKVTH